VRWPRLNGPALEFPSVVEVLHLKPIRRARCVAVSETTRDRLGALLRVALQ
jgi:hypothetical protein